METTKSWVKRAAILLVLVSAVGCEVSSSGTKVQQPLFRDNPNNVYGNNFGQKGIPVRLVDPNTGVSIKP